jgi:hypothetical protein
MSAVPAAHFHALRCSANRSRHLKAAVPLLFLILLSRAAAADDYIVDHDRHLDFSTITTFAFGRTSIGIDRPEIRNPLIIEQTTATIRAALVGKGLEERAQDADVVVEWTLGGQGFAVNPWGRAIPTDGQRDNWRDIETPAGGQSESFIEGLLVVDVTQKSSGLLIWRGVYRDTERDAARLARKLAGDARKLLSRYPSRKR